MNASGTGRAARVCLEDDMAGMGLGPGTWEDLRLRAMPASLRAAVPVLLARLDAYGDGVLTDRELRVGLLGPVQFARLTEALLVWGWMARDERGLLVRTGAGPVVGSRGCSRGRCACVSESD